MGQLNVRIDDTLKQRGDRIFEAYGLSPSNVVRAIWKYAADNREIPAFLQDVDEEGLQKRRRQKQLLAKTGAGMATGLLGLSPIAEDTLSYEELRELAYLERFEDR